MSNLQGKELLVGIQEVIKVGSPWQNSGEVAQIPQVTQINVYNLCNLLLVPRFFKQGVLNAAQYCFPPLNMLLSAVTPVICICQVWGYQLREFLLP